MAYPWQERNDLDSNVESSRVKKQAERKVKSGGLRRKKGDNEGLASATA